MSGSKHALNPPLNPTMVRLLQFSRRISDPVEAVSIPQWCDCCSVEFLGYWTPRQVSIPQWCDCCWGSGHITPKRVSFQSHNGAIAAFHPRPFVSTYEPFQSHNGAIAAADCLEFLKSQPYVSIPQWCDCCKLLPLPSQRLDKVSIPQWCDCCSYLNARQ